MGAHEARFAATVGMLPLELQLELQQQETHISSEERSSLRGWLGTGRSNLLEVEKDYLRTGWEMGKLRTVF